LGSDLAGQVHYDRYPEFVSVGAVNLQHVYGMDATPDGTELYGVTSNPFTLVRINQDDGMATNVATITNLIGGQSLIVSDLVIDPRTGEAFLSTSEPLGSEWVSRFYALDLQTGVASFRGNMNASGVSMLSIDLAINCLGDVFAHDIVGDQLLSINRFTGAATLIGATGIDANFFQSMDFYNPTGQLYGWVLGGTDSPTEFRYGTFNTTTGAFTTLSTLPLAGIEGTFPAPCWLFRNGFGN